MERPEIELIEESIDLVDDRIAKGTVIHLIEYIKHLESRLLLYEIDVL